VVSTDHKYKVGLGEHGRRMEGKIRAFCTSFLRVFRDYTMPYDFNVNIYNQNGYVFRNIIN